MQIDIPETMTIAEAKELVGETVYFVADIYNPNRVVIKETTVAKIVLFQDVTKIEVYAEMGVGGSYDVSLDRYHFNRRDASDELNERLEAMRRESETP